MKNSFIAPKSITEMIEELEGKENIIVLEGEDKFYVSTGTTQSPSEDSCEKNIMLHSFVSKFSESIGAFAAFERIKSSYLRTVI